MRDIRAYHIDEWWQDLKEKTLSPHYMNDILQWLKRFFTEARDLDIIEKVPHFPMQLTLEEKEIEWFTQEQQETLLEHIPAHDQGIFNFLFLTGSRNSEGIALSRQDVSFSRGLTVISRTVKRDGSVGPTKGKKYRVIPHTPEIEDCLKQAMKVAGLTTDFVFLNKWGRRYSDDYLRKTKNKACIEAGLPIIPLKNIARHSFGMQAVSNGVDIWTVSKAMGHADIKMTENYVQCLADQTKKAYKRSPKTLDKDEKICI